MRKLKYTDEEIEEAAAHNETDDKTVLAARSKFIELEKKYEAQIKDEKQKVIDAGGLKIIGTQRHESRRIDNQLRGRSGRQGDPGESRFYIGLDDDLMKIFGGDVITKVYNSLGAAEDMPIESRVISKAVENAQKKVEGRNFSIRKNVLQYDDVMNVQRTVIYDQRRDVLEGKDLRENILKMIASSIEILVDSHIANDGTVNKESLSLDIKTTLGIDNVKAITEAEFNRDNVINEVTEKANNIYLSKEQEFGEETLRELERVVMLKVVDQKWMDHIDNMDELKKGIGLQGYGQKDPFVQYRLEGTEMFDEMIEDIRIDVAKILLNARKKEGQIQRKEVTQVTGAGLEDTAINLVDGKISEKEGGMNKTVVNEEPKIGRNDLCPCGSGKKYKNCCGK
jgi:preprotein translocase subunit SecA